MNYERGRRDTARPTGFADMAQGVSQRVLSCAMCLGCVEGGVCVCMRACVCGRRGLRLHAHARVPVCVIWERKGTTQLPTQLPNCIERNFTAWLVNSFRLSFTGLTFTTFREAQFTIERALSQ